MEICYYCQVGRRQYRELVQAVVESVFGWAARDQSCISSKHFRDDDDDDHGRRLDIRA